LLLGVVTLGKLGRSTNDGAIAIGALPQGIAIGAVPLQTASTSRDLRQGDKAVSTTTGEELVVTELFSVNGLQMAKIKYLRAR